MNAKQIWINNENNINTWMCLVKDIHIDTVPQTLTARIAADSKYWLWINGREAVFEGGTKRGKSYTYYDKVDIAKYLTAGRNRIAILVWFFGDDGFSHVSSGKGGLVFESDTAVSDDTWKIKKHPAYIEAPKDDIPSNFRFAESNVYFDAAKHIGEWFVPDYDVSDWKNADIIENSPWGRFVKRIIPQLKDYGIKPYVNSDDYREFVTVDETIIGMKLPYNAQLTPCLKITAPAGKRISIKADNYDDNLYDTKSVMAVYYTKDGLQEYESLGWMNGETIYYTIPEGVTIHELSYHETGYNTEFTGSFECDDEFLNKLWQKSLRTLYITMRDNFMDCPDRERAQWWGDVNVEMQMMMYCLDEKALLLYKKGVDSLVADSEISGHMLTVVPSGKDQFELPMQNLAGIWGFMVYYDYTGDISVIKHAYPMAKAYLELFDMDKSGLIKYRTGSWDWADWGENADSAPMENAWYYMALSSCRKMAELLQKHEDYSFYEIRMDSIKNNYNRCFLKDGYYYDNTKNGLPDDRANALAVLSGLADSSLYESILQVFKSTEEACPYMEYYVLTAMCEMGYIDEAVERMKKRYKEMTEYDYSTLWEYWSLDGTKNHAWSGGPLVIMSKYLAGIRPAAPGYLKAEIKPHKGKLKYIKCTVPTVNGTISINTGC